MKAKTWLGLSILGLALSLPVATALAEQVYGSQLMTEQERAEHREKMRSFKTEKEREQYRMEHHKKMQERAKERGVTLPDSPQQGGKGMNGGGGGGGGGGGKGR